MRLHLLPLAVVVALSASAWAEEEAADAGASVPYPGEQPKPALEKDEEMTEEERKARKEKAANYVYCEYDDCYELLGVREESGPIPIKRAYRKLAAEWHPDRCPGGDIEKCKEVFPKYANAYEVLSNSEMRRNYDYVRKHPYEFPGFYMKYSRPKYAPKSDLRFVLLLSVLIASAAQYFLRKSQFELALSSMKKDPRTRYQERLKALVAKTPMGAADGDKGGSERPSSSSEKDAKDGGKAAAAKKMAKQERIEAHRKECEASLDAELAAEMGDYAPRMGDTYVASAFKLPLTVLQTTKWYLAGGSREPAYRTRRALGVSESEWGTYSEAEQAELVGMELWHADKLAAYEEEIRAQDEAAKGSKGKSTKEKRLARFKKNNPSSNAGLDG